MCRNILGQLTQVQSLFTYGENESVDTFARPDFLPMFSDNISWSDNSVRLAAEAQCGNDYECLFDVASTNDLSVGIATKDISAQLVNESNILGKLCTWLIFQGRGIDVTTSLGLVNLAPSLLTKASLFICCLNRDGSRILHE